MKAESDAGQRSGLEGVGDLVPLEAQLRTFYTVEPPKLMRAEGFTWDHEVRVALPPKYHQEDKTYPVLWITDNVLENALPIIFGRHSGIQIDLILVSVGHGQISIRESEERRMYDFTCEDGIFFDGPCGEYLLDQWDRQHREQPITGGADGFLDFLVDDVRPALAAEYRMDPYDHALVGVSGGGLFVAHSLFRRPGTFSRYICGSPALNNGNYKVFRMESDYAAHHDDLRAHVFLGAGEAEITQDRIAALGCVSSMVRLAETLTMRNYPSLRLSARVFPGESHGTMWQPVLSWGIRAVWAEKLNS